VVPFVGQYQAFAAEREEGGRGAAEEGAGGEGGGRAGRGRGRAPEEGPGRDGEQRQFDEGAGPEVAEGEC